MDYIKRQSNLLIAYIILLLLRIDLITITYCILFYLKLHLIMTKKIIIGICLGENLGLGHLH